MESSSIAKKGLIRVTNIRNVSEGQFDKACAIVRRLGKQPRWTQQIRALSPSDDLLDWYLRTKRAGRWSERAFKSAYVPRFLKEMTERKEASDALDALFQAQKNGETIAILCFCPDEEICHRSIVACLPQGMSANAETDKKKDYRKCHAEYVEMKQKMM